MGKIISVHSYRGGTGKSNLTANLSTLLAMGADTAVGGDRPGRRVGVIDTDIQSPGIHVIFALDENQITRALNDYLWGTCEIQDTAYDMTPEQVRQRGGALYLIPSSIKVGEIARVIREGYDVHRLTEGFEALIEHLHLDYLVIDTHPGLNEETLLSVAISDVLVLLLRPDRQDFQGTAVTVEVARKLGVPDLVMVLNKVLPSMDLKALAQRVEDTYHAPVAAVLPLSEQMMQLASGGVFCLHYPDLEWARSVRLLARRIA
jgi:MinD-like ATPase involved in chromosome partitioning or flagellar assembly